MNNSIQPPGKLQTFQDFLTSQSVDIPVVGFLTNLLLAAALAFLLSRLYLRCGPVLSNRRGFATNFVLLTVTTMLVISIVKSSLALSLGLVGALSIVRFRAAIKEPSELSYLFLSIAIGLGFGADQGPITAVAFVVISAIVLLKHRMEKKAVDQNLYLTISSRPPHKVGLDKVVKVLAEHCQASSVTRFDESGEALEAVFRVEFKDFEQLHATKLALQSLSDSLTISFMESEGVI